MYFWNHTFVYFQQHWYFPYKINLELQDIRYSYCIFIRKYGVTLENLINWLFKFFFIKH